jgi:cytoskeleton protein RodZ
LPVHMTNFGASLKRARESKGISLDQIAKETRISTRFLAAIENEEFHLLPGGVFNRGFVRSFAERVGLDPDQTVADYERLVSPREPAETGPSAAQASKVERPKPDRRLYPIAIGILALAIVIFYVVTRESNQKAETATSSAPVVSTPPEQTPTPAPSPATTETNTAPSTAQELPTPAPPASVPPAPPAPVANTQALTLDIAVTETTWIRVRSDGNSVIPGEILEPGMTRKFTAENSISISVGNAAGLTLKINDMPLKPLGKSGQVRSVTITPATLKDFIG